MQKGAGRPSAEKKKREKKEQAHEFSKKTPTSTNTKTKGTEHGLFLNLTPKMEEVFFFFFLGGNGKKRRSEYVCWISLHEGRSMGLCLEENDKLKAGDDDFHL